jgi:hypothetical protein
MILKIKSISLFALFFCLFSISAYAQVFDNWSRSQGVPIVTPTVIATPIPQEKTTKGKNKKLVKKTSQTMSVSDGLGIKESAVYTNIVMSSGKSLGGFTTGDAKIDSYIIDSCKRYNIDPLLIYAQMHQESSFKLRATSYKGASGLMQLMPATARRFGVTSIYDPKQNIEAGIKYMRWLLDTFNGDVSLALAGYNAGEGAVMKYGWRIPPYRETQDYVKRISARYNAIGNPTNLAKVIRKVSNEEATNLREKEPSPTSFEPIIIRSSDGKTMLVN